MNPSSTPSTPPTGRRFPWRRFGIGALYMSGMVLLAATITSWAFSNGHYFFDNLVISACIGGIAFCIIDGVRLNVWGEHERPNWAAFLALIAIAVSVAQLAGARLAAWLLGRELSYLYTFGTVRTSGMLLFTLLSTGAVTLFFASRDRAIRAEAAAATERARAEAVERQALQARLQLLQAQLEPHMLFNTLANLQGLIALDPARAQAMLDQLIQYLRGTLISSRAEETTLGQEFALLRAYLGLMAMRMGDRLQFDFELPDALRDRQVPPMLLQPLVENAIVHGLEPTIDGGRVTVSAAMRNGALVLTVADDGRGPDAGPGKPGTGVGLANTRDRLRALYGAGATLAIEAAEEGGTVVRIIIPKE